MEDIWNAIYETERWPEWWPGVIEVEKVRDGDEQDRGAVFRHLWRSRIPYAVRFEVETTVVEPPHRLDAIARGKLAGEGKWRLAAHEAGTIVTYEWNVRTTVPWMNLVAPLGRPVFEWNHHVVMRWGGEGLARRLGARLVARS